MHAQEGAAIIIKSTSRNNKHVAANAGAKNIGAKIQTSKIADPIPATSSECGRTLVFS